MTEEIKPGAGRMLAEARLARGLTVAQVAEKLKLTSRQIEAIEAEDYSRLPAAVFVRGFIRNYARLLELPQDSLPPFVEAAAEPTETITAHSEELRFSTSPVKRWLLLPAAGLALFMLLVAALYAWLSRGEEAYVSNGAPTTTSQPLPLPMPVVPVEPGSAVGAEALVPALPAGEPTPVPTTPAPTTPASTMAAPVSTPAPAPVVPPVAAVPSAPARSGHVVQLSAELVDAWIEVVSADDKRYTRLLRAGEQLTLRGAPPFRLVVGNAASVRVTYDDRPIDLKPYTGDKVARLTLE